jgi:hypothetical protein
MLISTVLEIPLPIPVSLAPAQNVYLAQLHLEPARLVSIQTQKEIIQMDVLVQQAMLIYS